MKRFIALFVLLFGITSAQTIYGPGGGTPGGSNTQIQYNNAGAFGGTDGTNAPYTIGPIPGVAASETFTRLRLTNLNDTVEHQVRASGEGTGVLTFVSDAGTLNAPAVIVSGDTVGRVQTLAYDGTNFVTGSAIHMIVDGTPETGGVPIRWQFVTYSLTADTSVTPLVVYGDRVEAIKNSTIVNCTDSAGAAACSSAPAGSVVMDAAATTVVVSTTAVTADSQVFIQEDSSLGSRLSVTCNTVLGRDYTITARTAGTSFTITASAAPATNPACLSYFIVN